MTGPLGGEKGDRKAFQTCSFVLARKLTTLEAPITVTPLKSLSFLCLTYDKSFPKYIKTLR